MSAEDARKLMVLRLIQGFLGFSGLMFIGLILFVFPAIHSTLPDQSRMLLVAIVACIVPVELLVVEVVIRKRKKEMLAQSGQDFETNRL